MEKFKLYPLSMVSYLNTRLSSLKIESWGASRLIQKWAQDHGMHYEIPDWKVVQEVNSKVFSFSHCTPLAGSTLLQNEREARHWMARLPTKKVLKSAFGVSGRGHLHIKERDYCWNTILRFLQRQWNAGLPVIAEPWVERVLDFSTQWVIEKSGGINYIGATICINDERGGYRSTCVGNETDLFGNNIHFLEVHKFYVKDVLHSMSALGYFGHVGIDAMLYRMPEVQKTLLHPLVEINARKTMGWAALKFQENHYPDRTITLSYIPKENGILPAHLLLADHKRVHFSRNLDLQLMSIRVKN